MVMSGSSMATYLMVSLILLIPALLIAVTVSDRQQQTPIDLLPGSSSLNIFKKAASSEQQLQNILEALVATQDYSNWAEVLSITDPFTFPITATFLIPADNPFINTTTTSSSHESLSSTISYHIIPQQLPFSVLQTFGINSRIPTLLPGNTILVTNNSQSNYTINEIPITNPDMYMNGAVVVHGIKSTLNYTVFGSAKDDSSGFPEDPFSYDGDDDNKKKNESTLAGGGSQGQRGITVSSDGTTFKKRVFISISCIMIYSCYLMVQFLELDPYLLQCIQIILLMKLMITWGFYWLVAGF
ncbi:hypothetical protein MKW94_019132 [Papaver nudicaule]|uniref:FAS1 domain-containing protein n=1 Tax=Papaver nudicaule TaxID=74823 RepID=A0AA42B0M3_PAPNU|nr:hypothetical protein [Papaver nudicaule]